MLRLTKLTKIIYNINYQHSMSARANRRAYSADQAVARARGRMNAKIDESIRMGRSANLNKTTARVTLQLPTNKYETLVSPDGTVSDAGAYYYQQLGIAPPSIFAYEQPLINNRWVKTFTGDPNRSSE